jgi:WD40 repeat protein
LVSQRDPRMRYLLSGASEGGMRLWNLADAEIVRSFQPQPETSVLAVAVDWQRMRTVCATVDGRIQLWDLNTGECLIAVEGHKEQVDCLEADFERFQAISGSMDGTAKLWCLKELKCLRTFEAGCTVWSLSVDWANKRACGGLRSGLVRLWDLETGKVLDDYTTAHDTAKAGDTSVSGVAIDCQGRRAVSGFEDGHLLYWSFADSISSNANSDVKTQDQSVEKRSSTAPKAFLAHYSALRAIVAQWREKGSRALVGSDDGSLSLWRVETSECLARFARHVGFVWAVQADWARDRAVSGSFDGCVKLWDLRTGECLRTLQGHSRPVRSVAGGG